ncbi:DNA-directed RNA polymerase II subunit RPB4 [Plasmodium brasilianum]|uniref:DNA-directed RNA polymerase II subunit RPB4, putative n=2 Tax=Plasmodium (Plasmodium) TaxID=418103 RepID=A0A1A8WAA3_PLAMA|nr:DNA-directed RNA polymerase II subunit RPB4, putative [Plasmodium malariae]KAI4835959.1 DNA-directed RNA polymerase II subunit RPB4 [Plasmodium brasilianum]SBS89942.1 DNA-directed RNA polymerase II subunit RPB4, putative [Plasmodium malariae]SCP02896.1 DNA-directed RNA polymerase II subunit RPB4, putative [Plasmodium malariae]
MKVLGKGEPITKFETFVVIKKELENAKNIDKLLCNKLTERDEEIFQDMYEKNFIKLLSDKILYNSVQKYIVDTNPHLISKQSHNKDYNQLTEMIENISNNIVNFFKQIDIYNFDKEEKIQMIDINCKNFVDLYVIMNYGDKKCDENNIEPVLSLLKSVHITNLVQNEQ